MNTRKPNLGLLLGAGTGLILGLRTISRRRARLDFRDRVAVITGGSRGLGLALAREFAEEGARLALFARDAADLDAARRDLENRGAEVLVHPADLRSRQQVEEALAAVVRAYGRADVLINNAGVIQVGPYAHMSLNDYEDAMAVHFWAALYATEAVLPYMRQQGGGRIVNITSIGGEVAVPHLLPYTASKFALVGYSDGLRAELSRTNIRVTTVVPGLLRTGSHVNAFFKGRHRQEYAWFSIGNAFPLASVSAQKAARQVVKAARYGDAYLTISLSARLMVLGEAFFPNGFAWVMKTVDRIILPRQASQEGDALYTGWESQSAWSPSVLTLLADKAVAENNELRGHPPILPAE